MIALIRLISLLVDAYTAIIFIYCILTWFPTSTGIIADIRDALARITDPFLDLFRKFIPPIGGMVDISPIVALLVLQFAVRLLIRLLSVFII